MNGIVRSWTAFVGVTAVALALAACLGEPRATPEAAAEHAPPERDGEHGEHPGEGGEHGEHGGSEGDGEHDEGGEHGPGEEGEESGNYIGVRDTWDETRSGVRLVLTFDAAPRAFVGTVENTTRATLCEVRVEAHLSNGIELGPTERADLTPGQKTAVELQTTEPDFAAWTAHPEVSRCAKK